MLNSRIFLPFLLLVINQSSPSIPEDVHIEQITSIQKHSWHLRNKASQITDKHSQNFIHQHLDEVVNNCHHALAALYNNGTNKDEKINDYLKKARLALAYANASLKTAQETKAKL